MKIEYIPAEDKNDVNIEIASNLINKDASDIELHEEDMFEDVVSDDNYLGFND